MEYFQITRSEWEEKLEGLCLSHNIFAKVSVENTIDYEFLTSALISSIVYNKPKPVTPLKTFFLPVRENVTSVSKEGKPRIVIGVPNCDVQALKLLDEIYLDKDFEDIFYRLRRQNTLIISADCFSTLQHCHCISYAVKPYSEDTSDLAVIDMNEKLVFRVISGKGREFIEKTGSFFKLDDENLLSDIATNQTKTIGLMSAANQKLPDYFQTGELVGTLVEAIWEKHSERCVSCGACTVICPTCSCFLLIDKPGFEKVKHTDACQYPGFERVAGGEDALSELYIRFKNRYMCKYVWKSQKFKSLACTGCGRCIEACIGKINKNEIFRELAKID